MKKELYTDPFEHEKAERDTSKQAILIMLGIMIASCTIVYIVVAHAEASMLGV